MEALSRSRQQGARCGRCTGFTLSARSSSSAARIAARCAASVLQLLRLRSLRTWILRSRLACVKVARRRAVVMSSAAALGPYSRASALSSKSLELHFRGHLERSDAKLQEALAAARVVGAEDCLVTAYLTVQVAERDVTSFVRLSKERSAALPDRPSLANKLRERADAVAGAAATARRRRTAGIHQPAEQAWFVAFLAAYRARGRSESEASASGAPEEAAKWASISIEVTVYAACEALTVLELAMKMRLFGASELSSRLSAACDLVDEATALAELQRVNDTVSSYDMAFDKRLRAGVALWRQESSTAALAERLAEALKLLGLHSNRSAGVQARFVQHINESIAERAAARAAASAPELLRSCALASCGAKEAHVSHFSRCAACKTVVYCSKTCQTADWPDHKKACKAARKAAEAAKTAAAGNAA